STHVEYLASVVSTFLTVELAVLHALQLTTPNAAIFLRWPHRCFAFSGHLNSGNRKVVHDEQDDPAWLDGRGLRRLRLLGPGSGSTAYRHPRGSVGDRASPGGVRVQGRGRHQRAFGGRRRGDDLQQPVDADRYRRVGQQQRSVSNTDRVRAE